jgi:hypothetical protein
MARLADFENDVKARLEEAERRRRRFESWLLDRARQRLLTLEPAVAAAQEALEKISANHAAKVREYESVNIIPLRNTFGRGDAAWGQGFVESRESLRDIFSLHRFSL